MFVTNCVGSTEQAERLLDFRASRSLEDGLRRRRVAGARISVPLPPSEQSATPLRPQPRPRLGTRRAIDVVAQILVESGVPATWLVTHASPAVVTASRPRPPVELGIHPNFLPVRLTARRPAEVLDHCMALVPDAVTMRTHALVSPRRPVRGPSEHRSASTLSLFLPRASASSLSSTARREAPLVRSFCTLGGRRRIRRTGRSYRLRHDPAGTGSRCSTPSGARVSTARRWLPPSRLRGRCPTPTLRPMSRRAAASAFVFRELVAALVGRARCARDFA